MNFILDGYYVRLIVKYISSFYFIKLNFVKQKYYIKYINVGVLERRFDLKFFFFYNNRSDGFIKIKL